MIEQAKGKRIVRYSKSVDDFYVRKCEHMMGSSGLIGFPQILKGVGSGRPPRTTSSSGSLREAASIRGQHAKDIAQMARYFGAAQ